jgi:hypothetical protein
MRKRRTLVFQQITDSRFMEKEKCLPVLIDRIGKIKQLLDIDGVFVDVGEPYLLNWGDNIQYRADFYIWKNTRKTTWNDIYGLVNSVKPVPYEFRY